MDDRGRGRRPVPRDATNIEIRRQRRAHLERRPPAGDDVLRWSSERQAAVDGRAGDDHARERRGHRGIGARRRGWPRRPRPSAGRVRATFERRPASVRCGRACDWRRSWLSSALAGHAGAAPPQARRRQAARPPRRKKDGGAQPAGDRGRRQDGALRQGEPGRLHAATWWPARDDSVQYADRMEVYLDEKGDRILRTVSTRQRADRHQGLPHRHGPARRVLRSRAARRASSATRASGRTTTS